MSRGQQFSDKELWKIVESNKNALGSVGGWDVYAKEQKLPRAQTIIKRLGKWNEIKDKLDIRTYDQNRPLKYTKEELIEILIQHKHFFKNSYQWNVYASEHNLPTFKVFETYLGKVKMEEILEKPLSIGMNEIADMIKTHFPSQPPTYAEWNELAKVQPVVSTSTIIRYFNGWNNMKARVYRK
ncbi:hypothetical protein [Cytobacillus purgationiresistens]|uniref:Phage antirepressor YoqD-like protein n=1 Tax=Cytobacillus purgationiresistens TaxID=863449 RepID=A0ABU0AQE1_9BACI|nr:hypothetical protein [Cytobacillus purgationiresistens]MDQ0273489.1 phage antirepressor YoqD-like protein [Cytobacillus purgationiresistens]